MSATNLEIAQSMMQCWGTGGFHGPDKDTNYDKFIVGDDKVIQDYRFHTSVPDLKPFDGVFVGKFEFFQQMGLHEIMGWQDLKMTFSQGPDDTVYVHSDCIPVRKATGKVASSRMCHILHLYFEDGKISKAISLFGNAGSMDETFSE